MDGIRWNRRVVQGLAEDDQVNALRFDRRVFQVAQAKLEPEAFNFATTQSNPALRWGW